jgi:hypothetical protein
MTRTSVGDHIAGTSYQEEETLETPHIDIVTLINDQTGEPISLRLAPGETTRIPGGTYRHPSEADAERDPGPLDLDADRALLTD